MGVTSSLESGHGFIIDAAGHTNPNHVTIV
jgi:hypothetical protein